ncbi:MAG: CoA transferase [Chloroflexi bacterium]|nr:CoA transferase [Chloroflexota bacterium]
MRKAPLSGIRMISMGTGGVIPDCGKTFGEFGADVIKIESRMNLDMMRSFGVNINANYGFNEVNRSKRSFGVNLKTEKGKALVMELVKVSDIFAENYRVGVVESLGLDYESLCRIKPDIIYISNQGFGRGGPYSGYKAYGPLMAAASGLLRLWAQPDDPYPVGSNTPVPDHFAAKHAVLAVLAALDYRRRTGKGQNIDMALVEVGACAIGDCYLDYTINGRISTARGNRSAYTSPHGCYRCKGDDQWCVITVNTDEEWGRFCEAVGHREWMQHLRFADLVSRLRNVDALDGLIEGWTRERESVEVMNLLQAADVPAGMVQRSAEAQRDPQLVHLNAFTEIDHPAVGKRIYPNVPFKVSGMTFPGSRRAPLFGEHTEEVCRELLGLSAAEIKTLKDEGVLEG